MNQENLEQNEPDNLIEDLIHRGGVYFNIEGETPFIVFDHISKLPTVPESVSPTVLSSELCRREDLLSTAVGNGIAIPHPRYPLLKDPSEQRIIVTYLDRPLTMNSIDIRPVYVFFTILTCSSKDHLKVLSRLAFLFQKDEFRTILEKKPSEEELLSAIKKYSK
jgi:PTS system nitrogen regulatory IIA component